MSVLESRSNIHNKKSDPGEASNVLQDSESDDNHSGSAALETHGRNLGDSQHETGDNQAASKRRSYPTMDDDEVDDEMLFSYVAFPKKK